MNRLVIETEEDWNQLRAIIRAGVRNGVKELLNGHRIYRKQQLPPGKNIWRGMIARCTNPNVWNYKYYGGRGIKVCGRWMKFENFIADLGAPLPGLSLERIDVNGNYEPSNCKWIPKNLQSRNTRRTLFATVDGVKKPLREWAELKGIDFGTLYSRVVLWGWDHKEAVTTPMHGRWKRRAISDRRGSLGKVASNHQGRKRKDGSQDSGGHREDQEKN